MKLFKINPKVDFLFALPLLFALSWTCNFVLVIVLVGLHLYTVKWVQGLAVIELLAFLFLYQDELDQVIPWLAMLKKAWTYPYRRRVLQTVALGVLVIAVLNWLSSWGEPFGYWDASVSYNRWAIDFTANQMPTMTWHYPQLLPANWSLSYVLLNSLPVPRLLELFPASVQGFFFVGLLLLGLVLYRRENEPSYLMGLILTGGLFDVNYFLYLNTGYADVPVAFFNFLAFALTLLAYGADACHKREWIWLSLFAMFAAAMTKPAGIYTALVIPLIQFVLDRGVSHRGRTLFLKYLLLVLLILPWYLYSTLHEGNLNHFTDIRFLIHGAGATAPSAMVHWCNALFESYQLIVMGAICFVFRELLPQKIRLFLYAALGYFLIWFFGFSYDNRNLMMITPLFAFALAFIIIKYQQVIMSGLKALDWQGFVPRWWMLIVTLVIVLCFFATVGPFSEFRLLAHETTEKNFSLHDLPFTMRLYAYRICPGFQGKLLTDYVYFNDLPMLQGIAVTPPLSSYGPNMEPGYFTNLPAFLSYMKANPEIHYLLLNHNFDQLYESPAFHQAFEGWLKQKKISLEWINNNTGLYKINVSNDQL